MLLSMLLFFKIIMNTILYHNKNGKIVKTIYCDKIKYKL